MLSAGFAVAGIGSFSCLSLVPVVVVVVVVGSEFKSTVFAHGFDSVLVSLSHGTEKRVTLGLSCSTFRISPLKSVITAGGSSRRASSSYSVLT